MKRNPRIKKHVVRKVSYPRVLSRELPDVESRCDELLCVNNNSEALCANPRVGKENADSVCHFWAVKRLLDTLMPSV